MDKSSSGSKGSTDSTKRRRETNRDPDSNAEDDDDEALIKSTGRSKKRTVKRLIKKAEVYDSAEEDYYQGCLDEDLDNIENDALNKLAGTNVSGRVLPQWTASWYGVLIILLLYMNTDVVIELLVNQPSTNLRLLEQSFVPSRHTSGMQINKKNRG